MNCLQFRGIVDALIDNELDQPVAAGARAHLANCPACASELKLAQRLKDSLQAMPQLRCPDRVAERAWHQIAATGASDRARSSMKQIGRWRRLQPVFVTVAATILVFGIGLIGSHKQTPPQVTLREARIAQVEAKLALAHIGDIGRRTGTRLRKDILERQVLSPMEKALETTIQPLMQRDLKEEKNAG